MTPPSSGSLGRRTSVVALPAAIRRPPVGNHDAGRPLASKVRAGPRRFSSMRPRPPQIEYALKRPPKRTGTLQVSVRVPPPYGLPTAKGCRTLLHGRRRRCLQTAPWRGRSRWLIAAGGVRVVVGVFGTPPTAPPRVVLALATMRPAGRGLWLPRGPRPAGLVPGHGRRCERPVPAGFMANSRSVTAARCSQAAYARWPRSAHRVARLWRRAAAACC